MIIYCFVNVIFEKTIGIKLYKNYRTYVRKKKKYNLIAYTLVRGEWFDDRL